MLPWLCCGGLAVLALALAIRLRLLQRSLDEVCRELSARLSQDTNTLVSVSSRDRHVRRLASELNVQLRLLRAERRRFQGGDLALREAMTNVSHDLRTPLTAICGYLELLAREPQTPDAARYLERIGERARALRRLMEELLDYSLAHAPEAPLRPEPLDLRAALEESVAALYPALSARGVAPRITMPEAPVVRSLDPAALSRVLGNILTNALKYSAGDLEIELRADGALRFTNSAPGLDALQVGRLFDRFFSVEAARGSTGLGLAIARGLTERLGGAISAQYDAGRLTVALDFPPA